MEEKLRDLRNALDDSVFKGIHFTEKQKNNIRNAVKEKKNTKRTDWFPKLLTAASLMGFVVFLAKLTMNQTMTQEERSKRSLRGGFAEKQKENTWELSPAFSIQKPGSNGKDVKYGLIGAKGKLAIVDGPVIASNNNKQLFQVGSSKKTEQLFNKPVRVIGTSKQDGSKYTAFEGVTGAPNEDIIKPPYHQSEAVGYLKLPSKGIWKLDAYVENKHFGSIVIQVQ